MKHLQLIKEFNPVIKDSASGFNHYQVGYFSFGIYCSPFFNCQNFSIAAMASILDVVADDDEVLEIVTFLSEKNHRRLVMLDVSEDYASRIKSIFHNKKFIVDQVYISSNGSEMHLFYIQIS